MEKPILNSKYFQNVDRVKSWCLPECSKYFLYATDSIRDASGFQNKGGQKFWRTPKILKIAVYVFIKQNLNNQEGQ